MLKLGADSLDWALSHLKALGDTDIFPRPFEFEAIMHCWDGWLRQWLSEQDIESWTPRPYRRCLSPKHRYSFRVSTQLDPLDALVFAALVRDIGDELEHARVPTGDATVCSYRFAPTPQGQLYEPAFNYGRFQERSRELADTGHYSHVVVTDIADFYPRLYLHRLENALGTASQRHHHVTALKSLIKAWNFSVSYGIPVGPAASRLLAEVTIDDVDRTLLSEGVTYCRYSDDFRLFASSDRQAHEQLALLANTLFENHGLTLQPQKTVIVDLDAFRRRYLRENETHERESLAERFEAILAELGIDNFYEDIEYDDLDPEVQAKIDSLNLSGILEEQITGAGELDPALTRFLLRRLGQIDDAKSVQLVIGNLPRLYPVFPDALTYVTAIRSFDAQTKAELGSRLVGTLRETLLGHLEYHRCWVFNIFASDRTWNNEDLLAQEYAAYADAFSRRKLTLALGRARHGHWFRQRKRSVHQFEPWEKRAFLAGASCLPADEARHWYRSIQRSLDPLERAVVEWARDNPF